MVIKTTEILFTPSRPSSYVGLQASIGTNAIRVLISPFFKAQILNGLNSFTNTDMT